jgi:hypothetical protein
MKTKLTLFIQSKIALFYIIIIKINSLFNKKPALEQHEYNSYIRTKINNTNSLNLENNNSYYSKEQK